MPSLLYGAGRAQRWFCGQVYGHLLAFFGYPPAAMTLSARFAPPSALSRRLRRSPGMLARLCRCVSGLRPGWHWLATSDDGILIAAEATQFDSLGTLTDSARLRDGLGQVQQGEGALRASPRAGARRGTGATCLPLEGPCPDAGADGGLLSALAQGRGALGGIARRKRR
jgi:hypothetical protein